MTFGGNNRLLSLARTIHCSNPAQRLTGKQNGRIHPALVIIEYKDPRMRAPDRMCLRRTMRHVEHRARFITDLVQNLQRIVVAERPYDRHVVSTMVSTCPCFGGAFQKGRYCPLSLPARDQGRGELRIVGEDQYV